MIMIVFLLGTFVVNSFPALVLFDSGLSQSFTSQSFCMSFDMSHGELECLLRVSIASEHEVSASIVFWVVPWRFLGYLTQ